MHTHSRVYPFHQTEALISDKHQLHCLLTLSAHVREGYSSHFVCLSVRSDFVDHWQLTIHLGINLLLMI